MARSGERADAPYAKAMNANHLAPWVIDGHTELIAHIGYPSHSFKSPLIYNPYFASIGLKALVVPMACKPGPYPGLLRSLFALENICGALITMPHKMVTLDLLDRVGPAARVAGACNAVKRAANGELVGDMFDGEGFVRAARNKGLQLKGKRALVLGSGGVGSAIAASLAEAGIGAIDLYDIQSSQSEALAERLLEGYPQIEVTIGRKDPGDCALVVNATPLGMKAMDPLPLDTGLLRPGTYVGDVVLSRQMTPFLLAAKARDCQTMVGLDMLYEMIPAILEFFGLPSTQARVLRELSQADGMEEADLELLP